MVYTVGETVLDIIFKTIDDVKVKPGGSILNTAVSLGRLGVDVFHISTMATDKASDMLVSFLEQNGVNSNFIFRNNLIKTSLALAYLNEKNNAEYTFYKDRLEFQNKLEFPELEKNDIVHYGSFFSINENMHAQLHAFLDKIDNQQVIKIYDPNFRKPHLPQLEQLKPMIENNFTKADIVKASDEDFENIYGFKTGNEAWMAIQRFGVKVLFYTKGERGSELYCKNGNIELNSHKIEVVSTIGAGDTYSAGIIYYLSSKLNDTIVLDEISLDEWRNCIKLAHMFSAQTCQSLDNYLSTEFCKSITHV
jgi:fructokinase